MSNLKELLTEKETISKQIGAVYEAFKPQLEPLETKLKELESQITTISIELLNASKDRDKDTGTFKIKTYGVVVKAEIDKTVKWDQKLLRAIWDRISKGGDDPGQYIKPEYKVPENSYKGWPDQIKAVFLPARTVTPGKPKFEYDFVPF